MTTGRINQIAFVTPARGEVHTRPPFKATEHAHSPQPGCTGSAAPKADSLLALRSTFQYIPVTGLLVCLHLRVSSVNDRTRAKDGKLKKQQLPRFPPRLDEASAFSAS